MFLAWIGERDLLPKDPSTDVLAALPHEVQLQIITSVVATVGQGTHKALASQAHVAWVMEAIGRGFALVRTPRPASPPTTYGCVALRRRTTVTDQCPHGPHLPQGMCP